MKKTSSADPADAVADKFDANVFVYSGAIDRRGYGALLKSMQQSEKSPMRSNVFLILTTNGGDADVAYQMARLFQNVFDEFYLCLPSMCKSAGTLIALGASEIIMWGPSELGPLDVQLMQRDEIGKRRSGLVVRTALAGLAEETMNVYESVMLGIKYRSRQTISFEVASRIAARIATGVMAPVYAQIDPEALGNDLRDLEVAKAYGERLIVHGKNADQDTVRRLVEDYPSHEFIIDETEAEGLFERVSEPVEVVEDLLTTLGNAIYWEQRPCFVQRLDAKPTNHTVTEGDNEEAEDGSEAK